MKQDELDYLQLMKGEQPAAYRLVVESDRLTNEKEELNSRKIDDGIHKIPNVRGWSMGLDTQRPTHVKSCNRTEISSQENRSTQKEKLAKKWTGPFKSLGVGPCKMRERIEGPKLQYLDTSDDKQTNLRVYVLRCTHCFQPHEEGNEQSFYVSGIMFTRIG